ncbi:amidohydrolase [Phycicoccus sp. Soil802]|uniref:amidohydrolase family protein n=1 Tax=Phycicoccus sp. Soil802 TaxID=1736414 RepID=UPI000703AEFF|nr:amidohydrolase family protein [Phycicoccus sp. Soil802]KRF22405.1 hypothetical protein ASG91_19055 [Phycicoccus sp. Soil802]
MAQPEIEVLDVDLEIVDAHHHLWPAAGAVVSLQPGPGQQVQKGSRVPDSQAYSLADFTTDATAGHRVVGSVFVECSAFYRSEGPERSRPVGETEAVARLASPYGLCSGIVAFADLMLGSAVGEVLDEHQEVGGERFKGIRHSVAWDSDPEVFATYRRPPAGLLLDKAFLAGAGQLAERGLTFDTWLNFHQLPELVTFAAHHPDLTVVLDHLGGPAVTGRHAHRRNDVREEWRAGIIAASRQRNVVIKLGAVGMRAFTGAELFDGGPASAQAIADYWADDIRFCIDTFGPDRCMFESNFPVDRALCDYVTLWNAFKLIAAPYSRPERSQLFAGTASSTYRL